MKIVQVHTQIYVRIKWMIKLIMIIRQMADEKKCSAGLRKWKRGEKQESEDKDSQIYNSLVIYVMQFI